MSNSLDILPLNQSKPELAKRKRKSWKGVTSIRKSARLNKDSVPLIIETKFSDEESYYEDYECNDNLSETCIRIVDDKSYHGMILEFFNYLEQPLLEMILSMIQKEKHLLKIGLWGHKKERRPPIEKMIDIVVEIIETQGSTR